MRCMEGLYALYLQALHVAYTGGLATSWTPSMKTENLGEKRVDGGNLI